MSVKVMSAVFAHSQATGVTRLVLLAIADSAWDDGVAYIQVESLNPAKETIPDKAKCSRATAFRAIEKLIKLDELQVVQVRRRSSFVNVYRVVVGRIRDVPIDYDRLPFELPYPFGSPSQSETVPTVSSASVQGLKKGRSGSHSETRDRYIDLDPSDPSEVQEEHPQNEEDEDPTRGVWMLRARHAQLRRERQAEGVCAECEYGAGGHEPGCVSGRETVRQSYERFVDEVGVDPLYPLEEIELVIATWTDVDQVERQEFFERAERVRATVVAAAEKAAA